MFGREAKKTTERDLYDERGGTQVNRVRWGILGTASIAKRQAIPAIQRSQSGIVTAIASRDYAKAAEAAEEFRIPHAFGSYQELIESEEVDVVYIPLPNDMHVEWIQKATAAGKHVLCEKPLGLNAKEVEVAKKAAEQTGRFVMEGVASHFHPIHNAVVQMVREGSIGELRFIRMTLGWSFEGQRDDYRWKKEHGGGGLLDIGCYCVTHSRHIAGTEPEWVVASATFDPETDVDTNMGIMLQFPGGVTALIDCGILSASRNAYEVIGSHGKIVVETPFGNGNITRKATLYDARGQAVREETLTAHQFDEQMESVSRCILEGKEPPISLEQSMATMRVLDACTESARNGSRQVRLSS